MVAVLFQVPIMAEASSLFAVEMQECLAVGNFGGGELYFPMTSGAVV